MESLLASAFDKLSSYDPFALRKGLRLIESLLAQLCLRNTPTKDGVPNVKLPQLGDEDDAAMIEFLRLQDGFEWNVPMRLITCLEQLLGKQSNQQTDALLCSTLDLLQGLILMHPASQRLFAREVHMTILLDLLEPQLREEIQVAALHTLVCALVNQWDNLRAFENLDGLQSITALFKRRDTSHAVKLKLLEFLYFYLIPEHSEPVPTRGKSSLQKQPLRRTTEEKQKMLAAYLNNVEGLVKDLEQFRPFGEI